MSCLGFSNTYMTYMSEIWILKYRVRYYVALSLSTHHHQKQAYQTIMKLIRNVEVLLTNELCIILFITGCNINK